MCGERWPNVVRERFTSNTARELGFAELTGYVLVEPRLNLRPSVLTLDSTQRCEDADGYQKELASVRRRRCVSAESLTGLWFVLKADQVRQRFPPIGQRCALYSRTVRIVQDEPFPSCVAPQIRKVIPEHFFRVARHSLSINDHFSYQCAAHLEFNAPYVRAVNIRSVASRFPVFTNPRVRRSFYRFSVDAGKDRRSTASKAEPCELPVFIVRHRWLVI